MCARAYWRALWRKHTRKGKTGQCAKSAWPHISVAIGLGRRRVGGQSTRWHEVGATEKLAPARTKEKQAKDEKLKKRTNTMKQKGDLRGGRGEHAATPTAGGRTKRLTAHGFSGSRDAATVRTYTASQISSGSFGMPRC